MPRDSQNNVSRLVFDCQLPNKNRIFHYYSNLCFTIYAPEVVITICPTARESSTGTTHRPCSRPLVWRHANVYLREVFFGCSRSSSAEAREETWWKYEGGGGGAVVIHIRGGAGTNGPGARRIRCRIPKEEEGNTAEELLLWYRGKNGATRRGRARLCGGEHREEAQQEGLSQERRRAF